MLKSKKKCSIEGCNNSSFSAGLCSYHAPKKALKKTTLKIKPQTLDKKEADKKQMEDDKAFYTYIWNNRPHRCQVCGTWLGNELRTYMMDHLLEKSSNPELRYKQENIGVVCMGCHECKSNGFPKEKHKEMIEKAKEIFGII